MKQAGKRALIITADGFEDFELFFPLFRLIESGWSVDVAAPTKERISGEHGYALAPDLTFDEVDPSAYQLLFIPGGFPDGAPATVRKIPRALDIARSFAKSDKPIASICHGPWTLVSADLVRGRRMTSYWEDGVPQEIEGAGGTWVDEPVVVDRKLVTSRYPMDLPAFMREVMRVADRG